MDSADLTRLLTVMRTCNRQLQNLGFPQLTAEQLRARHPALADLEQRMPGLVDKVVAAAVGDDEAARHLQAMLESAGQESAGVH